MDNSHPGRKHLEKHNLELLWDAASRWYKLPKRAYHNERHANSVVDNLFQITYTPSAELIMAARWHDAVYCPGSAVNEIASGDALHYESRRLYPNNVDVESVVDTACLLIERTTLPMHLMNEFTFWRFKASTKADDAETLVLLDADLASLAAPWSTFNASQRHIVQEAVPGTSIGQELALTHHAKVSEFLSQFLSKRKHIYHTDLGREKWEDKARANIIRFGKMFQVSYYD